ncbi:hypothetical protein [Leptospira licerasiae]|uniref:Phage tail protein n=1 Tax=Leptospira licerasiae str. MMD4847 TaxID=1049971 RepID=A0ABN0H9M7_9LEPT|nr:hypothetical protein [Leptospira licerasiae]EIE01456.1 hypothetical protein LEP1GSC185_3944 [Leptospira licerasiae serovar Varillal str. VAR 010]EJZ42281.1 hypothetical protein LEP1GSC178_0013 [Leptospira licerasiae str. MMD4847]
MGKVFDFSLFGVGSKIRFGRRGAQLKYNSSSIEVRNPDDSDFATLKVASPSDNKDAVNLEYLRSEVLANWNVPVQNISELQAIPANNRNDKQIREVEDELAFYQFDAQSLLVVPDPIDSLRVIKPNDLSTPSPGRWIKTTARAQQHSILLGLSSGNDHPQYQLRSERNVPLGYVGLSSDPENPGIEIISVNGSTITSKIRSLATAVRQWFLPDKAGTLATDDPFVGASESSPGEKGLVPTPIAGEQEHFLSGDGTWRENFGSLKNTQVKTSDYAASKYERVLAEVTNGGFSITLPSSPKNNSVIGILDIANLSETNPITLLRNGNKIQGFEEDWQLDLNGGYWELTYSESQASWFFLETPAYNNLNSGTSVSDSPLFTEISVAPSARSVKQYTETKILDLLQTIFLWVGISNGVGQAPTGTIPQKSWFEGITDITGTCILNTPLGSNILNISAWIEDGLGNWSIARNQSFDNSGTITIGITDDPIFQEKFIRVFVWHK